MNRPRIVAATLTALLMLLLPTAAAGAKRDSDRDRMPDRWERRHHLRVGVKDAHRDRDRDRLSNLREHRLRTNPRKRDSDGDGIVDGRDRRPRRYDRPRPPRAATPAAPAATATAGAVTRPVSAAALSDGEAAARVRRTGWEPRPANRAPNHTAPSAAQLQLFYATGKGWDRCEDKRRAITGNFTGTTDEIIQWTAWKWGLDEDLVRAQAVTESWWDQLGTPGDGGVSFGLMQIKSTTAKATAPMSSTSTAFNLDYYGATLRYYFDGCATWLADRGYRAGDLWGAVGAWFSGNWHDAGAREYVGKVRHHLNARTWARAGF